MRPRIQTQAYIVAAIPLIFLLAVLALALLIQSISANGAAGEQSTQQILRLKDGTMQMLDDAGRSAVSYTGTTDERKLSAYHTAQRQLPATLDRLSAMVKDQPGMQQPAATLRAASQDGMALVTRYVEAVRAHHPERAKAIVNSPSTRAINRRLATADAAFVNAERSFELAMLDQLRHRILRYEYALIALTVTGFVLTLFTTGRFGFELVQRVRRLAQNAELLAAAQPAQPIEGSDEFADLDRVYRAMMERIAREQRTAAMLQRALLPQALPQTPGIRIDTAYVPAADDMQVGGDWYDVFPLSPSRICVSVGDVAGHGLRAAALMATSRIAVRTAARVDEHPSKILRYVNRVVCADEPNTLVTAFVGVLDTATGEFSYASAGHPPPLLISPDETARYLSSEGFVLGAQTSVQFEEATVTLVEGNALVIYTDGIVEIERQYEKGQRELLAAALAVYAESPSNMAEAIQRRVTGTRRLQDDAAVIFIGIAQLGAHASERIGSWSLDARDQLSAHRVKRALLWHLAENTGSGEDLSNIELIFGELLGNVARHTSGAAEVSLEYRDGSALLHVYDAGSPFTFNRNGEIDLLSEGGRGLLIVDALSNGLSIERTQTGNRVTAVLPVAAS